MAAWLKGHELRVRTFVLVVGLLLFGISFAGALHWIRLSPAENLVLAVTIFLFIVGCFLVGRLMTTATAR